MFGQRNFETILGGSHVSFKKREHQPLSASEQKNKQESEWKFQDGIVVLRRIRTRALAEQNPESCQHILSEAHQLSNQMAEVILEQALNGNSSEIGSSFSETLQKMKDEYAGHEADSGHGLPSHFSVQNLMRAMDDMLVRIEEKAASFEVPDHKLTKEEMIYVINEFLRGTNDLTVNAREKFFEKDTAIGGILTGGSVYLEMVKKVIERYGEPSLIVDTFVIAVDKENKKAVFEKNGSDDGKHAVIITDDVIDKGGTLLTALWSVGEHFPNATIYSGLGTDQAGGFEKRRTEKHAGYLSGIYDSFVDLAEEGRNEEAMEIFRQAENYAMQNKVELRPGWHKRKVRMEKEVEESKQI